MLKQYLWPSETAVGIAIVTSLMTFLCLYISRWWRQTWDTAPYFTAVNQSEARISTEHGIIQITPWKFQTVYCFVLVFVDQIILFKITCEISVDIDFKSTCFIYFFLRYQWKKDGATFDINDETVTSQGYGGTITLDGTMEIGGYYQCIASNEWGKALSNNTYLPRARK